jgi:DNA invertase Pin-like site-specific DNA recombinase
MELLEELCLQAQGGGAPRFRVIMAWSVDRLERSLQDLMAFLSEIHAKGVELCLHQQRHGYDHAIGWRRHVRHSAHQVLRAQERRRRNAKGSTAGRPKVQVPIGARFGPCALFEAQHLETWDQPR